jgi:hypothetical protein
MNLLEQQVPGLRGVNKDVIKPLRQLRDGEDVENNVRKLIDKL